MYMYVCFNLNYIYVCPDHRGSIFSSIVDDLSTLAPAGEEKEVEYFFASDARSLAVEFLDFH